MGIIIITYKCAYKVNVPRKCYCPCLQLDAPLLAWPFSTFVLSKKWPFALAMDRNWFSSLERRLGGF